MCMHILDKINELLFFLALVSFNHIYQLINIRHIYGWYKGKKNCIQIKLIERRVNLMR